VHQGDRVDSRRSGPDIDSPPRRRPLRQVHVRVHEPGQRNPAPTVEHLVARCAPGACRGDRRDDRACEFDVEEYAGTIQCDIGDYHSWAAVYLWHCDRDGNYSLYSTGSPRRTTCAGSRRPTTAARSPSRASSRPATSAAGRTSAYEVYSSLANATSGSGPIVKTSQLAFTEDAVDTVYETADGYTQSVSNLTAVTLATDNVFSEDSATRTKMATVTGSVADGYTDALTLTVGHRHRDRRRRHHRPSVCFPFCGKDSAIGVAG
ncbi:MAG: hypothetical protein U5N55_11435, partial [Cypionkella sp.]|nr:hypothetical protein [Cypionkella sp.]